MSHASIVWICNDVFNQHWLLNIWVISNFCHYNERDVSQKEFCWMVLSLVWKLFYNCNNQMLLGIDYKWTYGSHDIMLKEGQFSRVIPSHFPTSQPGLPFHFPPLRILGRDILPPPSPILAWSFSYVFGYTLHWAGKHWGVRGMTYFQLHIDLHLLSHHAGSRQVFMTLMRLKFHWLFICIAPFK